MDPISSSNCTPSSPPHTHNQQPNSLEVSDEDGVGGDSNSTTSSGTSETEFANEQSETEHLIMDSISSPVNKLASSPFLGNNGSEGEPQLLHHTTTTNSRANFSQFETPADETRNNFGPDDFDEQLFIGQLGNCTDPRRFDEELEPQVIMDTADHSESSDVEDMFTTTSSPDKLPLQLQLQSDDKTYKESSSSLNESDETSSGCFPRSPISHQSSGRLRHHHRNSRFGGPSGGKRKGSRGGGQQRHDAFLEKQAPASPGLDLLLHKAEVDFEGQELEHLNEEDLSCDNALDTESIEEDHDNHHHHHIPICLNFANSSSADDDNAEEEQSTSRSCLSTDGLKSSPMVSLVIIIKPF